MKSTHYFHARCDPRHFSDTTFTSSLDPDSGSYVGLDTIDGLTHAHRVVAAHYTRHFAARQTCRAAQDQLLGSLDATIAAADAADCDKPLSPAASRSLPRSRLASSDRAPTHLQSST
jgi:hypothetical protein